MGRAKKKAGRKRAGRKKAVRRKAARKSVRPRGASRKKAAKKAAKKKTTRRTTGATRAKKTGSRGSCWRVDIPKKGKFNPKTHLSKGKKEGICWRNKALIIHTIHFTSPTWPFLGPRRDLVVAPTDTTECLYLADSAVVGRSYDYTVIPPVPSKTPPPDGPAVIVDG